MFLLYTLLGGVTIFCLFLSVLYDSAPLIVLSGVVLIFTFLGAFANFYDGDDDGGTPA